MKPRAWIALLVTTTATPAALAQATDKTAAIAAFDEGQALMEQGDFARACEAFARSHRLDPQLGALLHLADCLERAGKLASAWSAFRDASDMARLRGDARETVAKERASALEPRLSRLKLVPPANRPEGLTITRNGAPVENAQWGLPIPVDPGSYHVEVSAPGYRSWQASAEIRDEGTLAVVEIPPLEHDVQSVPQTSAPGPAPLEPPPRSSSVRWPVYVAGGVTLAGAAVWTIFGLKSMSAKSDADALCQGTRCPTQEGVDRRQDAIDAGNVATVGMIATGVGLAATLGLWFALPTGTSSPDSARVVGHERLQGLRLQIGPGSVVASGEW